MTRLDHFACFPCRKAFKQRQDPKRPLPRCPQCRAEMTPMGEAFRAPRRNDVAQWSKVELLRRNGVSFQGVHDLDTREIVPTSLKDVPKYLAALRPKTAGERKAAVKKPSGALPTVRCSSEPGRPPFAQVTAKAFSIGDQPERQVQLDSTDREWVGLSWRAGALYLVSATRPVHVSVNGAFKRRLPSRLHPGDVLTIGPGRVVLDW
jgi:hypothetical protein